MNVTGHPDDRTGNDDDLTQTYLEGKLSLMNGNFCHKKRSRFT